MTIDLRPAVQSDLSDLLALNALVQSWHAEHYPTVFHPTADETELSHRFRDWINDDAVTLTVAQTTDAGVVGYILTTQKNQPQALSTRAITLYTIEHIVTAPQARRQGIGTALIQHALDSAPENAHISLISWAANTKAHSFFERFGFAPAYINFTRT